jgi:hypothetical protein
MADAAFTTASVFFGLADMGVASGGQRVRLDATMGQSRWSRVAAVQQ